MLGVNPAAAVHDVAYLAPEGIRIWHARRRASSLLSSTTLCVAAFATVEVKKNGRILFLYPASDCGGGGTHPQGHLFSQQASAIEQSGIYIWGLGELTSYGDDDPSEALRIPDAKGGGSVPSSKFSLQIGRASCRERVF